MKSIIDNKKSMENLVFIKAEIIIFFLSLIYILYYFGEKVFRTFMKMRDMVSPSVKLKKQKNHVKKLQIKPKKVSRYYGDEEKNIDQNTKKSTKNADTPKHTLNDEEKQKIIEILKKVKVYVVKGYFDSARSLIIEGLAIDNFNKDLNMNLANIYEKENKYQNAEYIYRDLSEVLQDDFEVKKKLGFNLAMQSKYKDSLKIYEQAHKQKKSDNEIISMLTDLTHNIKDYQKCLKYVNLILKEKPRDVERMFLKGECLENIDISNPKYLAELEILYKKILEIQPYNTLARDKLKNIDTLIASQEIKN